MHDIAVPRSFARRRVLQGMLAASCAILPARFTLAGPAPGGFTLLDAATARTLQHAMHTLFPHAALGDAPYIDCVRAVDARAATDPAYRELIMSGLARLPADFAASAAQASATALGKEADTPFFKALRAAAGAIYRNPAVWPHFGYPGPSVGFGGYVDKPMLELAWLEEAAP